VSVIVIVQGTLKPDKGDVLKRYQDVARPVIARHGGEAVARGAGLKAIAGHHDWKLGIVLRFPDLAAVEAWHEDPEYQRVIPLRSEAYADLEINVFQE